MKKRIIFLCLAVIITASSVFAEDFNQTVEKEKGIQNHINKVGFRLLNANQIDKRMVFAYNKKDRLIKGEPEITKRQIILYEENIKHTDNDDEIAALLAREICKTAESYTGEFNGAVGGIQTTLAPKKYEIFFDKRAVDFMVKAGYNPLGMITYINKSCPQKRFKLIGRKNLASVRLANVYEYIYKKYPVFLVQNDYTQNSYYQNFLLTSQSNRKKLQDKIKSGSREIIKYE